MNGGIAMSGSSILTKGWFVFASLALMAMVAGDANAQAAIAEKIPMGRAIEMSMPLFKSRVVSVEEPTGRVAVGNPDVADIVVISPTQMYVLAKDIGTTNVLFWSRDNRLVGSIDLEVVHDLDALKAKLHKLLPDETIEVYSAQRSIILKGRASNVSAMNAAVRIAEGYLAQVQTAKMAQQFEQESASRRPDKSVGSVINLIEVGGSQQVMLKVKVAEIERTELKRLNANFLAVYSGSDGTVGGVNGGGTMDSAGGFLSAPFQIINQGFFGTFVDGNFRFSMALDAAKENGLAKVLAEPTLTTLTGQEAEFLSGGEFPIPVNEGLNGVTVEFKKFGVGLKFVPVVLSDGRINLKINVSVSQLTDANSLVLETPESSLQTFVPAIKQRSATATVELGDGQSMGLAGLLDDNLREVVTKFPGLGSIPVLGALFRSSQYQKGQTELVIMVTPHLAKPVAPGSVTLPTDRFVDPSDLDFYFLGRLEGSAEPSTGHQMK